MTLNEKKCLAEHSCVRILVQALLKIREERCGDKTPVDIAWRAISDWDAERGVAMRKVSDKTKEVEIDDNINRIDIKEFRELGYLQEVNRLFFHRLGLALEVKNR